MPRKRVCVLSQEEVGRLLNHDIQLCHRQHRHITIEEAALAIAATQVRAVLLVDSKDNEVRAVVRCESEEYVWRNRQSAGYQVRQMVPN